MTGVRRPKIKPSKLGGKKITMPNMYVSVKDSLRMYTDKSAVEKAALYYEEEGMPIPNFEMMDNIERLEALNEWRNKAVQGKQYLDELNLQAERDFKALELKQLEKQITNKIENEQKRSKAVDKNGAGN